MGYRHFLLSAVALILVYPCPSAAQPPGAKLPAAREMAAAATDVWGEAALRQPGGPSYEFFKDLLPPLRYVNTAFRHFPLVLGAPGAAIKAQWVSNGSAINARADSKPMWKEAGFPVHFLVGDQREPFGEDLKRLRGPRYLDGWRPIVQTEYDDEKVIYEQEAFAATEEPLAAHGAVFVSFAVQGNKGTITARLDPEGPVRAAEGAVRDASRNGLVLYDAGWQWDADKKELKRTLKRDESALLVVLTRPLPAPLPALSLKRYLAERQACYDCWEALLKRGMFLAIPEAQVRNAWRSLIVGNYLIAVGDRMHYSAGNAYDHLYEAECGDATRALLLYGYTAEARRMVGPLLDFNRQATRYHVAGHKLQLLADYYWVTRDATYLREKEKVWKPVVEFIRTSRRTANGLLPKDNYAGDINQQVYSLNSNANCWRGLRDMAAVLADLGEREYADELSRDAESFRAAILDAVAKSERRDVRPPFIPMSLLGDEQPYETLPATRLGSYYDLMAPYVLGSGIFAGTEREGWMIDYLRQHGGIALGMIRSTPHQGQFAGEPGVNVLYGLRYQLALLRRDDRGHALVGFYGQLAHGMTRDTFIGGEGSRFFHGDKLGRSFYLPPNSAANATFLTTLRYLLIQDWEDERGRPRELRLLYGVPGRWFEDDMSVAFEHAPTRFGEVSLDVLPHLKQGRVDLSLTPPPHRPDRFLVRLPLPEGWRAKAVEVDNKERKLLDNGVVDLTGQTQRCQLSFRVEQVAPGNREKP